MLIATTVAIEMAVDPELLTVWDISMSRPTILTKIRKGSEIGR
jgi:hypothetical protein